MDVINGQLVRTHISCDGRKLWTPLFIKSGLGRARIVVGAILHEEGPTFDGLATAH